MRLLIMQPLYQLALLFCIGAADGALVWAYGPPSTNFISVNFEEDVCSQTLAWVESYDEETGQNYHTSLERQIPNGNFYTVDVGPGWTDLVCESTEFLRNKCGVKSYTLTVSSTNGIDTLTETWTVPVINLPIECAESSDSDDSSSIHSKGQNMGRKQGRNNKPFSG